MDVVVVHDIRDPETFWGAVQDVIDVDRIPGTITGNVNPDWPHLCSLDLAPPG
jgi:hypothetical protein